MSVMFYLMIFSVYCYWVFNNLIEHVNLSFVGLHYTYIYILYICCVLLDDL